MAESGFMGMVLNKFLHFPDLWGQFSVRIHLLVSCFSIFRKLSRSMDDGYTFKKFLRIYGYAFEKFLRIMCGTITIGMAQPCILETQVTPPPPGSYVMVEICVRQECERFCVK